MMSATRFFRLVLVSLLAVAGSFDMARGQRLQDRRGVLEVGLVMRQLDGVKRVLIIGAHPDDEDTNLLTALARGMGVETAYLSLTRGDGGQNLIGPELGEGLGIIRTGELEAARALDGGSQFFGRAFDYGYSKSADEAFRHWPRDGLVEDVVRIIRTYRPQVVVTVWTKSRCAVSPAERSSASSRFLCTMSISAQLPQTSPRSGHSALNARRSQGPGMSAAS